MPIELGSFSLGAIAGGIVIGIANHFLSKSRNREDRTIAEFNKAATTFRNAFVPQLSFLKHNTNIGGIGNTDDISGLLNFGYVHYHLKAFEIFKDHLSTKKRTDINKAWQKCYHPDDPKILNVSRFSNKSSNGKQKSKEELKKLTSEAIERIEEILKFAEHK